ncbi:MAG: trimethylamine methyltransferase family protein [Chloroflexi bacterium]|nr:trimethylamine methyltransferase family protein [Chloroflexota bacterium]
MNGQPPALEPIHSAYRLRYLTDEQLNRLQEATLDILENVGVKFPSEEALRVFSEHGAQVNHENQIVKIERDMVFKAMKTVPRYFVMGARIPEYDLQLQDGTTYFTTDGCGVQVCELETGTIRPSAKADVGMMARVADYLPSIGFYWPMVSAQECGATAPLHEIEASWNNTVKHVQSETIMGKRECEYAVEMATVIAGSREELRKRPPLSLVVCTIAPLMQDHAGIEGAMIMAKAGIPVGFLAMPCLGTTAPATHAGALAMGDAEIISAVVLMQLCAPGAPVFHSLMQAWADPRTGGYVSYPRDARGRYGVIEMAHHWGLPSLGACYGTDSLEAGTWQSAAEPALDPLLAGLVSPEIVTGMGLARTYTRLYPEQILLDNDLYQRARAYLTRMDVDDETLAMDTIRAVGPGGHFLAQRHTRKHIRTSLVRGLTHELDANNKYRNPHEAAREQVRWILDNHHPQPLDAAQQAELARILSAADREIGRGAMN